MDGGGDGKIVIAVIDLAGVALLQPHICLQPHMHRTAALGAAIWCASPPAFARLSNRAGRFGFVIPIPPAMPVVCLRAVTVDALLSFLRNQPRRHP
jgi:hypothetical protein